MDGFEKAFKHIIAAEAGYVNHPLDTGGPTRWGITQATLTSHLGRQASIRDVQTLTLETAKIIYRRNYWDSLSLGQLPERLSIAVFDQAVNRSPYKAAITLQMALGATQDGSIGPKSIAASKTRPTEQVLWSFLKESMRAYIRIVKYDPTQSIFINGWMNRIFALTEELLLDPLDSSFA